MKKNSVKNRKKSKRKIQSENVFVFSIREDTVKHIIVIAFFIVLIIFMFLNISIIIEFIERLITILSPIILGWFFTFIMTPLYNNVYSKLSKSKDKDVSKFAKMISTIICIIIVLALSIGLMFLFVPQLYNSITSFLNRISGYLLRIREIIENIKANSNNNTSKQILQQVEKSLVNIMDNANKLNYSAIASGLFTGFALSFKAILNYFLAIVVMIYSLNLKRELCRGLKRILFAFTRKDIGEKILVELDYAKRVFSGFFVGKLLDSLIIGIICYVCCLLLRMPYPPLLSVIVGVTNIIPFFGPFIGAIPAFILIFLELPLSWKPWGFLALILVLQQVDGNIIGPKILSDKTGVGSFWVLFSIILFGGLFGFVGMVVAVPLWAVITRLADEIITAKLNDGNINGKK